MLAVVLKPIETRRGTFNAGDKIDISESVATQLKGRIQLIEQTSVYREAKIVNGELICLHPVEDLAAVIVSLTEDNLSLQKRLLLRHCQQYSNETHFWNLALKWEVKTGLLESKGHSVDQAEILAAEELNLLAFMDELKEPQQ